MSDSKTAAPVHRVALPKVDHRSSFVLFYYPNFDANFAEMAKKVAATTSENPIELKGNIEGLQQEVDKNDNHHHHNTMLDLAMSDPTSLNIPFGEYIMRKWSGVFKEST